MFTQCTHCQAIFELDEGTLQAAFGIVECGHCHQRFDALERLANELRDLATDAPGRPRTALAPKLTHTIAQVRASGTRRLRVKNVDLPPDADLSAALIDATAQLEVAIRPEPATWREIELPVAPGAPGERSAPASATPAALPPAVAPAASPAVAPMPPSPRVTEPDATTAPAAATTAAGAAAPEPPDTLDLLAQLDAEAAAASTPTRAEHAVAADAGPASPASIDAGPDTPDAPAVSAGANVMPAADAPTDTHATSATATAVAAADESRAVAVDPADALAAYLRPAAPAEPAPPAHYYVPPRHSVLGRELGWIAACFVLALLLAGQVAVASRAELYRNPSTRDFATSLCHAVGCDLPLLHEPSRLEWMSRDIRPLPSTPGALMITGTLRNAAAATQAYPVVVVQMTDIDGSVVAMRRFRPAEYMPNAGTRAAGIAPGATVAVAFEVADPGRGAVSYQFGFE